MIFSIFRVIGESSCWGSDLGPEPKTAALFGGRLFLCLPDYALSDDRFSHRFSHRLTPGCFLGRMMSTE